MPHRFSSMEAARRGKTLTEVVRTAETISDNISMLGYLDTLYYAWKSGRVPSIAYIGASMLKIKPIFELSQGKVKNIARIIELIKLKAGEALLHATVIHTDARANAERFRQEIASTFECKELFISECSPVMGAHTGPGLLRIAFWQENK